MGNVKKLWVCCFSQTGTEIYNISKMIRREPDVIVTNKPIDKIDTINKNLADEYFEKILFLPKKPEQDEYITAFPENSVITLHGYLRIIPPTICDSFEIYNSHPAPLTMYPELKGKDPQRRIYENKLTFGGNTIHRCTAELDSGEIMSEESFNVKGYDENTIIALTHKKASYLWCTFLRGIL